MNFIRLLVLSLAYFVSSSCLAFDGASSFPVALRLGSHYCQGCHDGVLAAEVGQAHPVGMDYRLAQLKSRGKLRDISLVDPIIQFEEGRVGCVSCHNLDSNKYRAKLIVTNGWTPLCVFCHNK